MVSGGRLKGAGRIGLRAGQVANKYKVRKHFRIEIGDAALSFKVDEASVAAEAALDGLYVIRTSAGPDAMSDAETVLNYKRLAPPMRILPGRLYLACTAQVYPRVNSWNSCCEVVEDMMPQLTAETESIRPAGRSAIA